jgi:hypothetical protein
MEARVTRNLSVGITWQFDMKKDEAIGLAKVADECLARIREDEAPGVDVHNVSIGTTDPVEFGRAVDALLR